jgi:hypothetical protein
MSDARLPAHIPDNDDDISPFAYPGVVFHDNFLQLPPDLPYDKWERMVHTIKRIKEGIDWAYGDVLNYGEYRWGEMYAQVMLISGRSYSSLSTAKSISALFRPEIRRADLPFSYHEAVAPLMRHNKEGYAMAMEILDIAEQNPKLVLRDIKNDVRDAKVYLGIEEERTDYRAREPEVRVLGADPDDDLQTYTVNHNMSLGNTNGSRSWSSSRELLPRS